MIVGTVRRRPNEILSGCLCDGLIFGYCEALSMYMGVTHAQVRDMLRLRYSISDNTLVFSSSFVSRPS